MDIAEFNLKRFNLFLVKIKLAEDLPGDTKEIEFQSISS